MIVNSLPEGCLYTRFHPLFNLIHTFNASYTSSFSRNNGVVFQIRLFRIASSPWPFFSWNNLYFTLSHLCFLLFCHSFSSTNILYNICQLYVNREKLFFYSSVRYCYFPSYPGFPNNLNIFVLYFSTPGWLNGFIPNIEPDIAHANSKKVY